MDLLILIAALGTAGAMGAWALWGARPKAERTLRAARCTPVASAREGKLVKLVGVARKVGAETHAPLTGRACLAYDVLVVPASGDTRTGFAAESMGCAFVLEDESGRALVELDRFRALFATDHDGTTGAWTPAPDEVQTLLARLGKPRLDGLNGELRLSYYEGVLSDGDRVAVVGIARWELDPAALNDPTSYRSVPKRLRMTSPPGELMLVSTEPFAVAAPPSS